MNEQDQKTAEQILSVVEQAITAAAPIVAGVVPAAAPEVIMGVAALRAVLSLMRQLGHSDAVREALDAELAAGRHATDEALAAKHAP